MPPLPHAEKGRFFCVLRNRYCDPRFRAPDETEQATLGLQDARLAARLEESSSVL